MKQPMKLGELDGIQITASEAFLAMSKFLLAYFNRTHGEGIIAGLCSDVRIEPDQVSGDPAALSDWLTCIEETLEETR